MTTAPRASSMDISVVAPHLQQPIADLVGRLIERQRPTSDRVSSNFYETGYAASAILLLVAMVESMVQRDRYFFKLSHPGVKASDESVNYLRETLKYRRHKRIRELFELRNAIAHNHIWEVEYSLRPTGGRSHSKSMIVPGTHRLRVPPAPNSKVPRTALVRFNLQPSLIERSDLAKALDVANHVLDFLRIRGNEPINLIRSTVVVSRKRHQFGDLFRLVSDAL